MSEWISQPANHFHGRVLPAKAVPAGYAALIERFDLQVPLPPRLTAIAESHHPPSSPAWQLLTPRYAPEHTLQGQLVFALKWDGIDLGVLAALFKAVAKSDVEAIVRATPNGIVARRLWFLYEWLTGTQLDVPEPNGRVRYAHVVDDDVQVALPDGVRSARHKVFDNLPGTRDFCPMVRWTPALRAAAAQGLDQRAREIIGRTHPDLMLRAAAFLLLSDSQSSFAIEGERPTNVRTARWADAIGQAGARPLDLEELERLQRIVIGDARFVRLGLRIEGGFIGTHDRRSREPLPDHISARPDDLQSLMRGLIDYAQRAGGGAIDPVIAAAATAFGFVYIHPFVDGNGRLHRWLVHHILAVAHYNPPGIVFPISAAILRRLDDYLNVLRSYSAPLLPFIQWRATPDNNIEVLNDTADYYRYFDATAQAEFLYACVQQTVQHDLPDEVRYLESFDRFAGAVKSIVEMPDRQIDLLRSFLQQGNGHLSARARDNEFAALSADETVRIEELYAETFGSEPGR